MKIFPHCDCYLFFPPAKNLNSGFAFESFDFVFDELVTEMISLAFVDPFADDLDAWDLDPRDFFESGTLDGPGSSFTFATFRGSSSLIPKVG
jgi:hypothetical protein